MPVIINEFEVVSQTPAEQPAAETAPAVPSSAPAPTPHDFENIIQYIADRLARLRAD